VYVVILAATPVVVALLALPVAALVVPGSDTEVTRALLDKANPDVEIGREPRPKDRILNVASEVIVIGTLPIKIVVGVNVEVDITIAGKDVPEELGPNMVNDTKDESGIVVVAVVKVLTLPLLIPPPDEPPVLLAVRVGHGPEASLVMVHGLRGQI